MKRQYQIFIDEMVKHGNPTLAYKAAYPKAGDESARVKSYTLLQNVTIAAAIKEQADKITAIATQKAVEELKDHIVGNVLSAQERKELLTKIANGEVEIPTKEAKWDKVQNKFVMIGFIELASHAARISAIAELNKMTGDYPPIKLPEGYRGGFICVNITDE